MDDTLDPRATQGRCTVSAKELDYDRRETWVEKRFVINM